MRMIAFVCLAVSLAAPAVAADKSGEQKPKKPHLICKRDDDTGSRMNKTTCKTAEEWAGRNASDGSDKMGIIVRGQPGGSGVVPIDN